MLQTLTGLRGFIALWVFTAHFFFMDAYNVIGYTPEITRPFLLIRFDVIGVDIFFVLSGFLLYYLYGEFFGSDKATKKDGDKFYLARLARIYPMHIFTLLVMWIIHNSDIPHPTVMGHQDMLFGDHWLIMLFMNLALIMSWGFLPVPSWNEPAWSISALAFAYLLFPFFSKLMYRLKNIWLMVVLLILAPVVQDLGSKYVGGWSSSDGVGAIIRVMTDFVSGCITCKIFMMVKDKQINWDNIFTLNLAGLLLSIMYLVGIFKSYELLNIFIPLLIISLALSKSYINAIFTNRVSMHLGRVSYSSYMLHYPYLLLMKHYFGGYYAELAPAGFAIFLHFLLISAGLILVSTIAYYLIEQPAHKYLRGLVKGRNKADKNPS